MTNNHQIPVLFTKPNSVYRTIAQADPWDAARNALNYAGESAIISHPPCRLWGNLRHLSTAPIEEKQLALLAAHITRTNGGILEHPQRSLLWEAIEAPGPHRTDQYGGFLHFICQSWFGLPVEKATLLYIVGIDAAQLPPTPFDLGYPTHSVGGRGRRHGHLPCSSDRYRDETTLTLANWLIRTAQIIEANK